MDRTAMMDLKALAIFVKVAERRSFAQAARDLGMTQSGVSNAISRLEDQLGVRLLARTTRRVNLTEDGAAFFERCKRILADLEEAEMLLGQGRVTPRGRLRIDTLIRTYLLAYAAPKTTDGKPDQKIIDAVTPAVRLQLGILDKAVAETGYLAGDQFTLADINLLPILYYVRQLPEGVTALAPATHLGRYYDRHAARPSFERTTPLAGPPRRASPN
jgi:DNA-binding transcriptional LysR family regulator